VGCLHARQTLCLRQSDNLSCGFVPANCSRNLVGRVRNIRKGGLGVLPQSDGGMNGLIVWVARKRVFDGRVFHRFWDRVLSIRGCV